MISNCVCIGVKDESSAAVGEFLFAPTAALHALEKLKEHITASKKRNSKVLIVFDQVVLHQFKERHVFAAADQPQSPVNIINEIME